MHFSPLIWEGNGGASYSLNVVYLARWGRWGGGDGAGSQEAGAGSPLQEAVSSRSGAMLGPWARRRGCPGGAKLGRQERSPRCGIL